MKQPVIVESIQDHRIVQVHLPNPKSEKSNTSRSFWGVKEKNFPASNSKSLDLHEGDMVEIMVDPSGAVRAAFLMFIFPLVCFFAAYKLGELILQKEALLYLLGMAGLAGGFGIIALIRKYKGPGEMPHIEKILSQADIQKWKSCNSACTSCKGCG